MAIVDWKPADEQIPIAAVNFDTNVVYGTLQLYREE